MATHMGPEHLFLAGADFNCDITPFTLGQAYIPNYIPTQRRKGKKIDYFVASGDYVMGHVSPLNIFDENQSNQIWMAVDEENHENYTRDQFKMFLDHSLVWRLMPMPCF